MSNFLAPRVAATTRCLIQVLAAIALATGAESAGAQVYPNKLIKLVVPYPPGATADLLARLLAPLVSASLKQPVVVENRAGASTNIGAEYVARSPADGYTLLMQAPNHITNQFMLASTRWKLSDFAAITQLTRYSNVLFAGPSAPTANFKELGPASKAVADGFSFGSPGVGSLSHLAMEMLKPRIGFNATHVVFTGPTPMITGVMGGHLEYGVANPANFMSSIGKEAGKHAIRPIVVLSNRRDPTIPDIPSLGDFGITDIVSNGWHGLLVPAKTPPLIVARLQEAFVKALQTPELQPKLKSMYLEPLGSTPAAFTAFIESESAKWGKAIQAAGIKKQ